MRKVLVLLSVVLVLVSAGLARAGSSDTPPPTPVPPHGSPSPFPAALSTPMPAQHPPHVQAAAAILEDLDTGQVLYARHADDRRAIASTTKIMTALVTLSHARPSTVVRASAEAAQQGSRAIGESELGLRQGERLTVQQLLYALLLQSANDAAVALADHVSTTTSRFVALMNSEAKRDGFGRTRFFSPNGLDDRGYSTARSLAAMTRRAERIPIFAQVVRSKFNVVPAPPGGEPRHIQNRNVLLWLYPGAFGVKTGFTTKAGFCLVATAHLNGTRLLAVVLGDPTSQASFDDAASLMDYGFHAFVPQRVIDVRQAFPPVPVGAARVPVVARRPLTAWVWAENAHRPVFSVRLSQLDPPLRDGDVVGTVQATLDGRVLGSVPLVVSGAPPAALQLESPHRATRAALWRRSLDALNVVAKALFHGVFG